MGKVIYSVASSLDGYNSDEQGSFSWAVPDEAVERARSEASGDLTIEGPTLAGSALLLGLVDVVELLLCPVTVGGGTPVFPDGLSLELRLLRERRFDNGMVQVGYEVRHPRSRG